MRIGAGLLAAGLLAACTPQGEAPAPGVARGESGAELYATYCAACHGADGRGAGPGAEGLAAAPADLTQLAARNGGTFPFVAVMAKIYGYSRGEGAAGPMPEFGPLMEGETVMVETDPGIFTPTPLRLVELAEYLRGVQG